LQDLFPLAKILYELHTRDTAFEHIQSFIIEPDPDHLNESTVALHRIIRKGLLKGFTSAQQMRAAVDRALASRPWKRYFRYLRWASVFLLGGALAVAVGLIGHQVIALNSGLRQAQGQIARAKGDVQRLEDAGRKLIVLQTDFGSRDHYMSTLKGSIYTLNRSARIEVITAEIREFDVLQAAWTLWRASKHYPKGTVFVVVTNPGGITSSPILVTTANGQIFIGHDNGCFDLVVNDYKFMSGYRLSGPKITPPEFKDLFGGVDMFGPAAARISSGDLRVEDCGTPLDRYVNRLPGLRHEVLANQIKGTVMSSDRYGNVTTNITRHDLESIGARVGNQIVVAWGETTIRTPLKTTYGLVSQGSDVGILFEDLLQLAVNEGDFTAKYKVKPGQPVVVSVVQ
jgi:hypothetical protein